MISLTFPRKKAPALRPVQFKGLGNLAWTPIQEAHSDVGVVLTSSYNRKRTKRKPKHCNDPVKSLPGYPCGAAKSSKVAFMKTAPLT